jgi:hypothetical protein
VSIFLCVDMHYKLIILIILLFGDYSILTLLPYVLQYQLNDYIIFYSSGSKDCGLGNFIKFGGEGVVLHHHSFLEYYLFVAITSSLVKGAHLSCRVVDHDPPLYTIDNAIGYIIMWPYKHTN